MAEDEFPKVIVSNDSTTKIEFFEGYHCVLIPLKNGKVTLCVSSQVGCALGCRFCKTGEMGLKRNLSCDEIIRQFDFALEYVKNNENLDDTVKNFEVRRSYPQDYITSIVFMGMGEPFNNYRNVIDSIYCLNRNYSFPFRKITVSTSGILPKMEDFLGEDFSSQLALSLHSSIQSKRDFLMPFLSNFPISELVEFCNKYSKNRRDGMMIEYIMIAGFNDKDEDIDALLNLGFDKNTNFNLIPLNGKIDLGGELYDSSSMERIEEFKRRLRERGYKCFIRYNMGEDIEAACGMLS